jgi:hypothetical protein
MKAIEQEKEIKRIPETRGEGRAGKRAVALTAVLSTSFCQILLVFQFN